MALPKLLIADSDAGFCQALATQLEGVCLCRCAQDGIAARQLLCQLADYAKQFTRQPIPVSELVVGMKCGGSDGLSGITARRSELGDYLFIKNYCLNFVGKA